jgi:tetratricopeptide (TPR) repeat protein
MRIRRNWPYLEQRAALTPIILGFTLFVCSSQASSAQTPATSLSFRQARRIIENAVPRDRETGEYIHFEVRTDELHVHGILSRRIETDKRHHNRNVQFSNEKDAVIPFSHIATVEFQSYGTTDGGEIGGAKIYLSGSTQVGPDYEIVWDEVNHPQPTAEQFVSALQWFISHASKLVPDPAAAQRFEAQAVAWRDLAAKPGMPEEARTHKVLAENAVQEKNFDKAADEYEAALQIFSTWPEGQFNLAVICGETGDYNCAIEHMQNYLELVPDAPDAQPAKDKIIIWKDKIAHSQ